MVTALSVVFEPRQQETVAPSAVTYFSSARSCSDMLAWPEDSPTPPPEVGPTVLAGRGGR